MDYAGNEISIAMKLPFSAHLVSARIRNRASTRCNTRHCFPRESSAVVMMMRFRWSSVQFRPRRPRLKTARAERIELSIITASNVTTNFRFGVILRVLPPSCFLATGLPSSEVPLRAFARARGGKDTLRTTGNATVDLLCTTWVIALIDTRTSPVPVVMSQPLGRFNYVTLLRHCFCTR